MSRIDSIPVDTIAPLPHWDSTGWRGRVVVGEYLTGIFCPGCQLHEQAFDKLLERYPTTVFIPIAYHGGANIPIADPADSLWERMYAWYGNEPFVKGLLAKETHWDNWIDGHAAGPDGTATEQYASAAQVIDSALRTPPRAALRIGVTPDGARLVTQVTVDSLVSISPNATHLAVRIVLLEDTVHLVLDPRGNPKHARPKIEHYMVVREAARSSTLPMGVPLQLTGGHGVASYTFDLERIQHNLLRNRALGLAAIPGLVHGSNPYMKGFSKDELQETIDEFKEIVALFPDSHNWTMNRKHLHIIVFVQDMTTGDILQTQMVPVSK